MTTTNFPRRTLGRQGLVVSAIGLGCMGMSDFYGASEEATNLAVLNHALDIGVNFLDTADMYGVGGATKNCWPRCCARAATKSCSRPSSATCAVPNGEFLGIDGRPEYVAAACDASLKRLGVEHIDLYYQHRVDPKVPIEETVGAMARLVEAGKVRHLGLSEASGATVRRAAKVHPIAALQSEYSLWTRDVEADDVLPACRELGIGFVAVQPARPRLPHRRDPAARRARRQRLATREPALPGRELRRSNQRARRSGHRDRAGDAAARRRNWRSRGCCTRAPTSCRSPARAASSASTKTPEPRASSSRDAEQRRIDEVLSHARCRRHALSRGAHGSRQRLTIARDPCRSACFGAMLFLTSTKKHRA